MKLPTPLVLLFAGIFAGGCADTDFGPAPKLDHKVGVGKTVTAAPIVTPDNSLKAKVVAYNSVGRFVVLSISAGTMPKTDQTLFLYRNGLKVSELKVTGPQNENNTVADVVTGDAQAGDDVRDQ
jgi:hypothetical protein